MNPQHSFARKQVYVWLGICALAVAIVLLVVRQLVGV